MVLGCTNIVGLSSTIKTELLSKGFTILSTNACIFSLKYGTEIFYRVVFLQ
ncbi:hypothetical protein BRCON_2755 [Candidatus Sumerlaea chitinivorans]|uniref:Uncharacterized protein n=1 Tax=Sumerlaea chitinivorans TaxID=2250252 RepID=A0A2Z4Y8B4_SUMC1|nr:hypothetical protein BRCON_2755 [Candidatus Sumerlaea chitinivorans]